MFAPLRRHAGLLVAGLVILAVGLWFGGHPTVLPGFVRDWFVDDKTALVAEAMNKIDDVYYRKIGDAQLGDTAVTGMVKGLDDRFSSYFTPKQYDEFQQSEDSQFSGVGMAVVADPRGLRVAQVYDGSPAKHGGIVAGDVVVGVNGKSLKGVPQDVAVSRITGPPGTDVTLRVLHAGKPKDLHLIRATVTVPVVASRLRTVRGEKVGVVALAQFSSGAHAEVYAALRRLQKRGAKAFVLDLRGNGGGLVSEAQLIASAFLRDGPIVTTRGRREPTRTLRAVGDPLVPTQPLAVLVDRNTASASEIVTGALQDRDRATVVGTRTYGKGVFQEVIDLSNGGALKLTAGQYFTPKGRNLGGQGVSPGQGIKPDVAAKDDPKTPKRDEALDTALRIEAAKAAKSG